MKTRLEPALGQVGAAGIYHAFILDVKAKANTLDVEVRWYVTPSLAEFSLRSPAHSLHLQRGDSLGARLRNAFLESEEADFGPLVVVGTDSPTLPTTVLEDAFRSVSEPGSAVIGPADDGGYYLLGLHGTSPGFFGRIQYSRADVAERTREELQMEHARLSELPIWYDVDTEDDLQRLIAELREFPDRAPETRRWLYESGYLG